MPLTLDWDALVATDALTAAEPFLMEWIARGWPLTLETNTASSEVLMALGQRFGMHPLVVRRDLRPAVALAESAVLEDGAAVGSGSQIWRFSHIRAGAVVGPCCNIGQGVYVDAGAVVGARCKLQNGVNVYRGVILGDGVFVGPAATFTNDRNPRAEGEWAVIPTMVGAGASIGANATVVCGNHIGPHALVAAGAVVTRPVPAHGLVAGVPARLLGWVCSCGQRAVPVHGTGYRCTLCGAAVPVEPQSD